MTFEMALKELKKGKKITRKAWKSGEIGIFLLKNPSFKNGKINPMILIETVEIPKYSQFQPTSCDVLADDWTLAE